MIKYIALCLILLIACACQPSPTTEDSNHRDIDNDLRYSGIYYVFQSRSDLPVIAIFIDEGLYRSYAEISEVGYRTDIGGRVSKCSDEEIECINIGGNYIMAPKDGVYDWIFSDFHFTAKPDELDPESLIITSWRGGSNQSIYKYSKNCGLEWIAFTYRDDLKHEIYRPVGRSLFSKSNCSHPSKMN